MEKTIDQEETYKHFKLLVNMTATELKKWLETEESESVGIDSGDGESIGRKSAKKIISILPKKKSELNNDDYQHMHKVIAYISRHSAQGGPEEDKAHSRWLYSLKNWGHDPLKDKKMKTKVKQS